MESNFIITNRARVNKIITIMLWGIFAAAVIFYFQGQVLGEIAFSLLIELSIASILILTTQKHTLTMAILFMAILTCTVNYIGGAYTGMIIATVLCIVSLYSNKSILFSFGGLYTITFSVMHFSGKQTENTGDIGYYFINMGFLALLTLVLYFVCKRNADLIENANRNEAEAHSNEAAAQNMVQVIGENTAQLHGNIDHCNQDIGILRTISESMSTRIKEVAHDVARQSGSLEQINTMIGQADMGMAEINEMSAGLTRTSDAASTTLLQSAEQFRQMEEQMKIINWAVQESFSTVGALNKSLEQVNGFLAAISQIASETNLLALNARIEAARAGEAGAGFSVVALQIKKLAEQSAATVDSITEIVQDIKVKTNAVLKKATDEEAAVQKGNVITEQVIGSFEQVSTAFRMIDRYIEEEIAKIGHVSGVFSQIRLQSDQISAIAHKNLTATTELLGANKEQDERIEIIYGSIGRISRSSIQLQELIGTNGAN
ncbi:methyl-accepting chemotaxis protein [Paenibacillus sp. MMS20-IR301]|uniref:methyl-accepting chemotaxis protein n=1 Tax=Paenibacillus sp. MMS20-IR301 TaxID=2895946 RepID=UPI0028E4F372|nr:methyl-accepting chemotaxis protein [Paenibacillus sp. MMS20-IR301]WNS43919.1 methyl-accepting chemotaxis protein [Paenibacillus sp. MMS20-IR301]